MPGADTQVFKAILQQPHEWRRVGRGVGALLAGYAALLVWLLTVSAPVAPAIKKVRANLVVTLFDAPKRANLRALGLAGGQRAASAGGNESTGPRVKVADPRPPRPTPTLKRKSEAPPKTQPPGNPAPTTSGATIDLAPATPLPTPGVESASSAPQVVASSTSTVGSRELGVAGTAGGLGGAGQGQSSGRGGTANASGAGTRAGVVSGDTQVLPFMDGMTRPQLLSKVDPEYSRAARDAEVEGLILTKCVITTAGALQRCRIVKGIPLMDQAVLAALSHWRYSPVVYQGKPVAVEYVIPVRLVAP